MSSSSSKSSVDSGRRPATGPGIGGSGGTVMPPFIGLGEDNVRAIATFLDASKGPQE